MVAQEPLLGEEGNHSKNMQNTTNIESDGEEETLSLCDLPLYSNSTSDQSADQWEQQDSSAGLDSQYGGSTSSSSQDDYFEFNNAAADFPPENIIFCGKLIPYKKQPQNHLRNNPMIQNDSTSPTLVMINESKKKRIEIWKKSSSCNGTKSTTLMMQQQQQSPPKKTKMYNTNKLNMSLFTSSSSSGKTKWYFLFFGIPRLSTEVELRDIKNRRIFHRQFSASPPASPPMFRFENPDDDDNEVCNGGRNRRWGLWGMIIKVLSCGGNHQSTAMAAASIGYSTPE